MINLSTSNFISSLLDSSDSGKANEKINGILAAIAGHSGAELSSKDVVKQLIGGRDGLANQSSVSEDDTLLNNIEAKVQGYIDNCDACDAQENLQAINDLYTEINSLVEEALTTEQKGIKTLDANPADSGPSGNDAKSPILTSSAVETSQSAISITTSNTELTSFGPTNADVHQTADRNSQIRESVDASKSNLHVLPTAGLERSSTNDFTRLKSIYVVGQGRGIDLAFDMSPGAAIEIPEGVSMKQIHAETNRLRQAIEEAIA